MKKIILAFSVILAAPAAASACDPATWLTWWGWVMLTIIQDSGGTIW